MSDNRISWEKAVEIIKDSQQRGLREDFIRQQIVAEGFNHAEFYEMLNGEENTYDSFDEKPKRKNDMNAYPVFERGFWLSAYLIFQLVVEVLSLFLILFALNGSAFVLAITFIFVSIKVMCIYWLWNGEQKGYRGLIGFAIGTASLAMVNGNIPNAIGAIIRIGILYALVNPKSNLLR